MPRGVAVVGAVCFGIEPGKARTLKTRCTLQGLNLCLFLILCAAQHAWLGVGKLPAGIITVVLFGWRHAWSWHLMHVRLFL